MATLNDLLDKYGQSNEPQQIGGTSLTGTSGPVQENLNIQVINDAKKSAERDAKVKLTNAQAIKAQQMEQQKIQAESERQQNVIQSVSLRNEFDNHANATLNEMQRNRDQYSQMDKLDRMETAAPSMRLRDQKYIDSLELTGRYKRLSNAVSFDDEMKAAVFDDQLDMIRENNAFKKALSSTDADFERYLASINIDVALQVAGWETAVTRENAMLSGIGTAAAGTYGAYKSEQALGPKEAKSGGTK